MAEITFYDTVITTRCYLCGVVFGMPAEMDRERRQDHKTFYCVNGHAQHYTGKTEAQKQRERAEEAERAAERMRVSRDAARDQAEAAERRRAAAKGQLTKVKKRVANGVCPCCNRTFADLAAHMSTKHPDYAGLAATPPESA